MRTKIDNTCLKYALAMSAVMLISAKCGSEASDTSSAEDVNETRRNTNQAKDPAAELKRTATEERKLKPRRFLAGDTVGAGLRGLNQD